MEVVNRYTKPAVVLHWLIAVAILVNIGLGLSFDYLPDDWIRPVINSHKSTGLTILGLVLLRIFWRIGHPPPPMPVHYARWERYAAHAAHGLLYALILALPISGWMHDSAWKGAPGNPLTIFGIPWFRIPMIENVADPARKEELHSLFGWFHVAFGLLLYGLLALHIGGALKHQFLDKEPELQRMSL